MIELVRYKAEHALAIAPVFDEVQCKLLATPAVARSMEGPYVWTAMLDGKPIACAGLAPKWLDSWLAWAYFAPESAEHMLTITRAIKKMLPDMPRGRIEAATPIDFKAGTRWLEMLGFKCETPLGMEHYAPDGNTYKLYSRINR